MLVLYADGGREEKDNERKGGKGQDREHRSTFAKASTTNFTFSNRWYRPRATKKMTVEMVQDEPGQGPFIWPDPPDDLSPYVDLLFFSLFFPKSFPPPSSL